MTRQRILQFPDGFLWGTASAAHQCEGGNTNNQWYRWELQGHILTGEYSGRAANWWEAAEADFALAEQMENNEAFGSGRAVSARMRAAPGG